jgi:hypothetical protein
VKWNNNVWLALGGGFNSIAYSITGIIWIPVIGSESIFNMGYDSASNYKENVSINMKQHPLILLGSGSTNTLAYSLNNGLTFSGLGTSIFSVASNKGIYNGSLFIALGSGTNTIAVSYSGHQNWIGLGTTVFSTSGTDICIYQNKTFIATGEGLNTFATSQDGFYWVGSGITIFNYATAITCNDKIIVACGGGDYDNMAYSSDGANSWSGIGYTIFDVSAFGVANDGRKFVAVGQGSVNTVAYSLDGITWNGLGLTIFENYGSQVAWNGDKFVAVGSGTYKIVSSLDGLIWTLITSSLSFVNSITWSDPVWIVTGNSTLYSYDSTTWTATLTDSLMTTTNGIISHNNSPYKVNKQINVDNQLDISSTVYSDGFQNFSVYL